MRKVEYIVKTKKMKSAKISNYQLALATAEKLGGTVHTVLTPIEPSKPKAHKYIKEKDRKI